MNLNEFNDKYANKLLYNLSKENKNFFFEDFSIDLLKYDNCTPPNKIVDSLSSNMSLSYILPPTRVSGHSKTLSLTIYFLTIFSDPSSSKSNFYVRIYSNFNKEKFTLDYFKKDWNLILNVEKNHDNHSFDNFLLSINELLNKYTLLTKLRKYPLKLKTKPWIT